MESQVTTSKLLKASWLAGGALLAGGGPAPAEETERYRVRVGYQAIAPKQGMYAFNARVRDADKNPVNDAGVYLRLHSIREPGYRLVKMERVGRGWYRKVAHVKTGQQHPSQVRVVIRDGEDDSSRSQ